MIARRNHKGYDLDNGTLGTIIELDESGMTLADDNGNTRQFNADDPEHVAYVSEHLEHAYALTAHGTQGATLQWAGVVGLPGEFSREWAYTALSRAKQTTRVYVVSGHTQAEEERKEYATVMEPEIDREKVIARMAARMDTRDIEEAALLQRARDGRSTSVSRTSSTPRPRPSCRSTSSATARGATTSPARRSTGCSAVSPSAAQARRLRRYARPPRGHRADVRERASTGRAGGGAGLAAVVEMIDELHRQAGGNELDYGQRQSLETLLVARDDITSRYPDPQGILNMKAKHDQSVRALHVRRCAPGRQPSPSTSPRSPGG